MNLFPLILPADAVRQELAMCRECAWDFAQDRPIFFQGSPVVVEGKEAVKVWAWNALKTVRYRHEIYPWDYGCEVESLMGQPFTDAVKQSEAVRYVRECLLESPYIESVDGVCVLFEDGKLSIDCKIGTVYGEVRLLV